MEGYWYLKSLNPRVRPTSYAVIVALVPFSAVNRKLLLRFPDETDDDDDWDDSDDGGGDQRNGADGYQLLPQNLDPPPANESHGTEIFLRISGRFT